MEQNDKLFLECDVCKNFDHIASLERDEDLEKNFIILSIRMNKWKNFFERFKFLFFPDDYIYDSIYLSEKSQKKILEYLQKNLDNGTYVR